MKALNDLRELIKQTSFANPSSKRLGKIKVGECKVTGQLKLFEQQRHVAVTINNIIRARLNHCL